MILEKVNFNLFQLLCEQSNSTNGILPLLIVQSCDQDQVMECKGGKSAPLILPVKSFRMGLAYWMEVCQNIHASAQQPYCMSLFREVLNPWSCGNYN